MRFVVRIGVSHGGKPEVGANAARQRGREIRGGGITRLKRILPPSRCLPLFAHSGAVHKCLGYDRLGEEYSLVNRVEARPFFPRRQELDRPRIQGSWIAGPCGKRLYLPEHAGLPPTVRPGPDPEIRHRRKIDLQLVERQRSGCVEVDAVKFRFASITARCRCVFRGRPASDWTKYRYRCQRARNCNRCRNRVSGVSPCAGTRVTAQGNSNLRTA